MSFIHPPTRGIQSVQTQQITAAAGIYSFKTTSPAAYCVPWQLWQPKLLSWLEEHRRQKRLSLLYLRCRAGGSFLKPTQKTEREIQSNVEFLFSSDYLWTRNCSAVAADPQMMVVIFNGVKKCIKKDHGFRLKKAGWPEAQALPLSQLRSWELGGISIWLTHTHPEQSWGWHTGLLEGQSSAFSGSRDQLEAKKLIRI